MSVSRPLRLEVAPSSPSRLYRVVGHILETLQNPSQVILSIEYQGKPTKVYIDRANGGIGMAIFADVEKREDEEIIFFDTNRGIGLSEGSFFDAYNIHSDGADPFFGIVGRTPGKTPHYIACEEPHFLLGIVLSELEAGHYQVESPVTVAESARRKVELTLIEGLTGVEVDRLEIPKK